MARQRDPRRDEAFEIWKQHNGEMKLKDIAEQLGVLDTQIRKWKSQDKWESPKGNVTNSKRNVTKQKESIEVVVESEGLTDKQRFFCIYYIKYFNATKAYQKAYECAYTTARVEGHRHLTKPNISAEIDRMRSEKLSEKRLNADDILQKYIDIAFADITDYLEFGREEEVVYDQEGFPELDANSNVKTRFYNYVRLNNSTDIDGTILTEVKEGREGVSIKLADKMKALDFLANYTDLLSDNDKKKLQEEKLKVDIAKGNAEIDKLNGDNDKGPIEIMISRKGGR